MKSIILIGKGYKTYRQHHQQISHLPEYGGFRSIIMMAISYSFDELVRFGCIRMPVYGQSKTLISIIAQKRQ